MFWLCVKHILQRMAHYLFLQHFLHHAFLKWIIRRLLCAVRTQYAQILKAFNSFYDHERFNIVNFD